MSEEYMRAYIMHVTHTLPFHNIKVLVHTLHTSILLWFCYIHMRVIFKILVLDMHMLLHLFRIKLVHFDLAKSYARSKQLLSISN